MLNDKIMKISFLMLSTIAFLALSGCKDKGETGEGSDKTFLVDKYPPVAIADVGPTNIVCPSASPIKLMYNGSESYDVNGEIISYTWFVGLNGNESVISSDVQGEISDVCRMIGDRVGTYQIGLTVEDNDGNRITDTIDISVTTVKKPADRGTVSPPTVDEPTPPTTDEPTPPPPSENNPPVANIENPAEGDYFTCNDFGKASLASVEPLIILNDRIELDGNGTDPDGDSLTFAWSGWVVDLGGNQVSLTNTIVDSVQQNTWIDLDISGDFCKTVMTNGVWDTTHNAVPVILNLDVDDGQANDRDSITVYVDFPT